MPVRAVQPSSTGQRHGCTRQTCCEKPVGAAMDLSAIRGWPALPSSRAAIIARAPRRAVADRPMTAPAWVRLAMYPRVVAYPSTSELPDAVQPQVPQASERRNPARSGPASRSWHSGSAESGHRARNRPTSRANTSLFRIGKRASRPYADPCQRGLVSARAAPRGDQRHRPAIRRAPARAPRTYHRPTSRPRQRAPCGSKGRSTAQLRSTPSATVLRARRAPQQTHPGPIASTPRRPARDLF